MGILDSLKNLLISRVSLPKFSRSATSINLSSHPLLQAHANKIYFQSSDAEAVWNVKDSSGHVLKQSQFLCSALIIITNSSVQVADVAIIDSPSNINQCEIPSVWRVPAIQ
ncbi:CNT_collapsed_G0029640.mRNA.1.CDS.1 [Saccharomyces cerevisiae]|nr:CNT_collapsed_G0029640.mRNA.1.CDS.1 [Saccharomyces cerevisiae]